MFILGINAYHGGASACLIHDSELVAAAEEERFRRIKYVAGFPTQAVRYCLDAAGITAQDLDHIGLSRDPTAHLGRKVIATLRRRPSAAFIAQRLANMARVRDPKAALCERLGLRPRDLKAQVHNIEHHRAHMASAFFVSPYREAAILSVDGMGDFVSTMWGIGSGNSMRVLGRVHSPHSLGIFYTALTQWLGFPGYGDEGKVMGLAPYGRPTCMDELHDVVRIQRDGTFELNLDYFVHHTEGVDMTWEDGEPTLGRLYSSKLVELLGPPREPWTEISHHHENVAASLQAMLEEAEFNLVRMLQTASGSKALCLAGGVALNSVFNGKVLPQTAFNEIYIQPAANDAGTAMGVCYYIYHQLLQQPRAYVLRDAGTGPAFSDEQITAALGDAGLDYDVLDDQGIVEQSADILVRGDVLGWFQGRMEWGPRALGYRSILADPRRSEMRDILNARIKRREAFRPFAPSVLLEATSEYFEQTYPDPFMLKVYPVRAERRAELAAVTHVDGSGRLQTVDRQIQPRYWALIHAFGERTGVPVVLNTSFNENEPIVCTPQEAIDCFLRTRMDALVLGNFLVTKRR
jgi:carbamoyltransferase